MLLRKLRFFRRQLRSIQGALIVLLSHWNYYFPKSKLPPGRLRPLQWLERSDRFLILNLSQKHGAIFKGIEGKNHIIFIVGFPECNEFIQQFRTHLRLETVELAHFFPKGFLRQMEGDAHKNYRSALMKGISPAIMDVNAQIHEAVVKDSLHAFSINNLGSSESAAAYKQSLITISTSLLIQIFFGIDPDTPEQMYLLSRYKELGDSDYAWKQGESEKRVYLDIRGFLLERLKGKELSRSKSILSLMAASGEVDETSLGNLIYMVEMGRYDMGGLFRWLTKNAAENPHILTAIAEEDVDLSSDEDSLLKAFVLETLRMDQIERLMRITNTDLHFGGFIIPKNSLIRLCIWESHKNPDNFPDPFQFKPERFLDNKFSQKEYAPFGMGHHRCPLAQTSIRMCMIVVKVLAQHYQIEPYNEGPAHRGPNHWEPAKEFTVRLVAK